jgi:hypothetical protein
VARQGGALVQPGVERVARLGVERDLPVAFALAAADRDDALAGADGEVVAVEGGECADPQRGEEQHGEHGAVPHPADRTGLGAAFGGAQQPAGILDAQRPGGELGQLFAAGVGGAEPDEAAEVVDRGQGEVDRGGLGRPLADEVGAVVPDGVVPGGPVGERVALPAAGWSNSASQDR